MHTCKLLPRQHGCFARQRGTTLIEALVAVVILSIGLLGMAGLQANALKLNQTSLQRSQATILAYTILDQMRSDTAAAKTGDYDIDATACSDELNESSDNERSSLEQWACEIRNTLGPLARGQICRVAAPDDGTCPAVPSGEFFRVTVQWMEAQITGASEDNVLSGGLQTLTVVGRL